MHEAHEGWRLGKLKMREGKLSAESSWHFKADEKCCFRRKWFWDDKGLDVCVGVERFFNGDLTVEKQKKSVKCWIYNVFLRFAKFLTKFLQGALFDKFLELKIERNRTKIEEVKEIERFELFPDNLDLLLLWI